MGWGMHGWCRGGGGFHCSPHCWIFTQEISLTEGKGSQGVGKYLNIIGLSSVRGGLYQWWEIRSASLVG